MVKSKIQNNFKSTVFFVSSAGESWSTSEVSVGSGRVGYQGGGTGVVSGFLSVQ